MSKFQSNGIEFQENDDEGKIQKKITINAKNCKHLALYEDHRSNTVLILSMTIIQMNSLYNKCLIIRKNILV
ncbi:unnamed protein product, partial [Larinioides sclopetarius]